MKKLNENVLRKLILETIDEQVMVEGKKKKKERLKEAEPVPVPDEQHDPAELEKQDRLNTAAAGEPSKQQIAQMTAGLAGSSMDKSMASLDAETIKNNLDAIRAVAQNKNSIVAAGAKDMLKNYIKQLEKAVLPGQQEE